MLLVTLRDLQYRKVRFMLVTVGTGLVFVLLLLMSGLTEQFRREPRATVEAIGADGWVLRAGATGAFTSAATLEAGVADGIRGATLADPLVIARHSLDNAGAPMDIVVIGYVPGGLGTPTVIDGRLPSGGEVTIDESAGVAVGDSAKVGSETFRVAGLTTDTTLLGGMPLLFMELEDAQALVYRGRPAVSAIVVEGTPTSVPAGYALLSNDAVAEDATRPLDRAISSVGLIRSLLWVVSAMIIGGVVYLSALERRRDFAVMKAVGTSTSALLFGLALQGVLVAIVAAILATGLQAVLVPVFPLKVQVTPSVLTQLPVVAVLIAILASLGGMRQVARTDPASAFGGPAS
jgi:putative ABC transport system permease protein